MTIGFEREVSEQVDAILKSLDIGPLLAEVATIESKQTDHDHQVAVVMAGPSIERTIKPFIAQLTVSLQAEVGPRVFAAIQDRLLG